jgi:hypothetical protein
MKTLKARHLSFSLLVFACNGSECPTDFVLAADGTCHADPTVSGPTCLTEVPLTGTVMNQSMAVNAFAYVDVGDQALALIGFQDQKDACRIVEDHVAGTVFWHDGLVLDMSIFGDIEAGVTIPLVETVRQDPEDLEMSIRVAETDVFQVASLAGSATVSSYTPQGILHIQAVQAEFQAGALEGEIKACHCPDLIRFWEIEAPDIVD